MTIMRIQRSGQETGQLYYQYRLRKAARSTKQSVLILVSQRTSICSCEVAVQGLEEMHV